jgi:hypothetical protein
MVGLDTRHHIQQPPEGFREQFQAGAIGGPQGGRLCRVAQGIE